MIEVKLDAPELPDGDGDPAATALCRRAKEEIEAFLRAELDRFTVPIHFNGTPFRRAVWKELLRIPYGRTLTYGQMARTVGDIGASRAVGTACGANPIPLIVPCHRVVAANSLGGFTGGVERKRWLLELEVHRRPPSRTVEGPGLAEPEEEGPRFDDSLEKGEQQSLFGDPD